VKEAAGRVERGWGEPDTEISVVKPVGECGGCRVGQHMAVSFLESHTRLKGPDSVRKPSQAVRRVWCGFQNGSVKRILYYQGCQNSLPSWRFCNPFPRLNISIKLFNLKKKKKKKKSGVDLDQALPLVRSFEARLYFLVGRVSRAPMS
jgi:hypothetical protein